MPGLTKISMYPRLWQITGFSYSELVGKLIDLAFGEYERKKTIMLEPDLKN
jgi:D-alanine-D-alanine ligase